MWVTLQVPHGLINMAENQAQNVTVKLMWCYKHHHIIERKLSVIQNWGLTLKYSQPQTLLHSVRSIHNFLPDNKEKRPSSSLP
jgi:hypothetical protein